MVMAVLQVLARAICSAIRAAGSDVAPPSGAAEPRGTV
jgi:hypothetical protein